MKPFKTMLKVGDTVLVTTGGDKGKTGKITAIDRKANKVTVDGVNIVTRHRKPSQAHPQGGVHKEARAIPISNVGIVNPSKKTTASRIGVSVAKDGAKKRVYRQADNWKL